MDNWEIVELLECVKINVENIKKGLPAEIVIIQIDAAIKLLTDDEDE
jgi:hypothetical protein